MTLSRSFRLHRNIAEVMGSSGRRPISLQKRHRITDVHLKMLKEHSLRSLQLPYVLDSDEQAALHKVIHEPLFLLGRSGSGKTSVQAHALYYLHKAPMAWFEDAAEKAGPVMLVTRALAASCSDQFQQASWTTALKYLANSARNAWMMCLQSPQTSTACLVHQLNTSQKQWWWQE